MIRNILNIIDTVDMAGIRSILGVELNDKKLRIVELKRKGIRYLTRYARFSVNKFFTVEFNGELTIEQRAETLRSTLLEKRIRSKHVVSNIQGPLAREVITKVPINITDLNEWISDHYEKLIKIPIAMDDVVFTWEILEKSEMDMLVQFIFVRRTDIEYCTNLLKKASLELVALSVGARETLKSLLVTSPLRCKDELDFYYIDNGIVSISKISNFRKVSEKKLFFHSKDHLGEILKNEIATGSKYLLAGEVDEQVNTEYPILSPFGLSSEYTLAAGLALKGFVHQRDICNILPVEDKEKTSTAFAKSLMQHLAFISGSILFVMLLILTLTTHYLQSRIENYEQSRTFPNSDYGEMVLLERQVNELEHNLSGANSVMQRTNTAKVLHDIAGALPESTWLYSLKYISGDNNDELFLKGYSYSNDQIVTLLNRLQNLSFCQDVKLKQAGTRTESDLALPSHKKENFVTFEIDTRIIK